MQFDWWTLGLQTVNVLILIWLLQRYLLKPIQGLVAQRREEVERVFEEASAQREDATAAERRFEEQQRDLAERSEAILEESHAKAGETYRETVEKGRREAEEFLEAERRRIEDERRDALIELRDKAVDLSIDLAGQLLGELDPATVDQAFLEAIDRYFEALPQDELAELRREAASGPALRVVTAKPLDDAEQRRWADRFSGTLGSGAEVAFDTDDALIAGAELHFRNAVVRFSWRDKLATLRKALASEEEIDADTPSGT